MAEETKAKINPQILEKLKTIEGKKAVTMQLLGMTVNSFERSKRKIDAQIETMVAETEMAIREIFIANNMSFDEWIFKDIDFKSGEIIVIKKGGNK
jgi:hypothetical protein